MGSLVFVNSRAKLWRAYEYVHSFNGQIRDVFDSKEHATDVKVEVEPHPKSVLVIYPGPCHKATVYCADRPRFTKQHGLLLGEALHNFRGSLDHLAWDLVHRVGKRRLSAKERKTVAFPLTTSRVNFWGRGNVRSQARRLLPDVPDRYLATIEAYQPYRRTPAGRAMRHLRNLSDIDKHRIIVPLGIIPEKVHLNIKYEGGMEIGREWHVEPGQFVNPGTKLATLILVGESIEVKVRGQIASRPIFPRSVLRPPLKQHAVTVDYTLEQIGATCLDILNATEAHP